MKNTPRKIKLSTVLSLLKRRPFALFFAAIFTFLGLFMSMIFALVFSLSNNDAPKVDYDLVNANGYETTAKITNIDTDYSTTINEVHPTVISYQYQKNGQVIETNYKVLEEGRIENLAIGDEVAIKEFEGQTIIQGLEPFNFPVWLFMFLPLPFVLIGLAFLFYIFLKTRRELKLYKHGKVTVAKIVSMIPKYSLPIVNLGAAVSVLYEYETKNGNKVVGESETSDVSIISDKKTGDSVAIFVAPNNETKSNIVPKIEALKNKWGINFD